MGTLTMYQTKTLENVWYASERRAKSVTKLLVYDEIGRLECAEGVFDFVSAGLHISMDRIESIDVVRQRPNYVIYLIGLAVLAPITYGIAWLSPLQYEQLLGISLEVLVAIMFLILSLLGMLVGLSTKWVRIRHLSEDGEVVHSYFADGNKRGWSGIFGGTSELYLAVTQRLERA